jgi:hypothetical protein
VVPGLRVDVQPTAGVCPHGDATHRLPRHPLSVRIVCVGVHFASRAARDGDGGEQRGIELPREVARAGRERSCRVGHRARTREDARAVTYRKMHDVTKPGKRAGRPGG